ncbi:MAG: hypothetical protein RMK29_21755 [Myxococcales bacterium]|nr:hypothetical protein [Myxococcota bacterium]MDW8284339.1 hypothetical protein [Myxococcales bacterium]
MSDFLAGACLRAARVGGDKARAGDLIEQQFVELVEIVKAEKPHKVARLRSQMAEPLASYRSNPIYRRFAHINLDDPNGLRGFRLEDVHRGTLSGLRTSYAILRCPWSA